MFIRTIFFIFLLLNLTYAKTLTVAEAFGLSTYADERGVDFKFNLAQDIYVYKDSLKISVAGKILNEHLNLPKHINDGTFDVYPEKFSLFLPINLLKDTAKSDNFDIRLEYQGCAKNGICYRPQTLDYSVTKALNSYKITMTTQNGEISSGGEPSKSATEQTQPLSEQDEIAQNLSQKSLFASLATFFGLGVLLSLTPCIFPMIPILSSIIVAKSGDKSAKNGFILSLIYVLGMAIAYMLAGVLAAVFGSGLQTALQAPVVLIAFSLVFVALALSMFGFYELQMPLKIQNLLSKKSESRGGAIGVFVMGFFAALIASPCVAAPLAGALLYIAQSGNIALGGAALFTMGLGMGVPLLAIGASSGKILPKPGVWMDKVKTFFGFIMLFMAIWLSARVIGGKAEFLLYGVTGVAMSVFFGAFDATDQNSSSVKKLGKSIMLVLFIYSSLLITGAFLGAKSILNPIGNLSAQTSNLDIQSQAKFTSVSNLDQLQAAIKGSTKPVLIDFYATWCVSCNELDEITFADANVIKRLEGFTLLRVDVTKNSTDDQAIMKQFGLIGPPALLFYNGGSELENEIKNARIIGFYDPTKFIAHLDKFKL